MPQTPGLALRYPLPSDYATDGANAIKRLAEDTESYLKRTLRDVKSYGAKGDGSTDDTAAIQAALTAAGAAGGNVLLPTGDYRISALTVPSGVELVGDNSQSYVDPAVRGARLLCNNPAQTAPVILLQQLARLTNLSVSGASATHDVIQLSGQNTLRAVTVNGGNRGVFGNYAGVNLITGCQIHYAASHGIQDLVDSMIRDSFINANGGCGIVQGNGAGDTTITGCKIEYNTEHGLSLSGAAHNIISGNIIDRNGKAGIRAAFLLKLVVSGNVLRRNGRYQQAGSADDDSNLFMIGVTESVVVGNVTINSGGDDNTDPYDSPRYAIREQSCADVAVVGNDLTGFTVAARSIVTAGERMTYLGNTGTAGVGPAVQDNTISRVGQKGTPNFNSGTSQAVTWTGLAPAAAFAPGLLYRITLLARGATNGFRLAGHAVIRVTREGGAATATVSGVVNTVDTRIATTGNWLNLSATCNTDGSELTLTMGNAAPEPLAVNVALVQDIT